jgi:hypothetical protein
MLGKSPIAVGMEFWMNPTLLDHVLEGLSRALYHIFF